MNIRLVVYLWTWICYILNAMCTFVYLFVVYFSFAPVISASIHRYLNYFDIQVLMMVTKTETLTSTLHHNIFIYLDYVFSATFILSAFNPYLLSLYYIIMSPIWIMFFLLPSYCHMYVGCPRGVMVKAMHCGIVVREFVLQSRYYFTLGKGMNPLILPPAMGK